MRVWGRTAGEGRAGRVRDAAVGARAAALGDFAAECAALAPACAVRGPCVYSSNISSLSSIRRIGRSTDYTKECTALVLANAVVILTIMIMLLMYYTWGSFAM